MHDTAYEIGKKVIEIYGRSDQLLMELGSYNINGSLRDFCPDGSIYLGLDMEKGPSVDIFVEPGRPLPIRDGLVDLFLTSSAFEHDPFFWETFLEIVRVTKPNGIIYLSAPSNGSFHRYPHDYWRFYPDSGKALEAYAQKKGLQIRLIESFTAERLNEQWNDFVAIFSKSSDADSKDFKFLSDIFPCRNVIRIDNESLIKESPYTEDQEIIYRLSQKVVLLENEIEQNRCNAALCESTLKTQLSQAEAEICRLTECLAAKGSQQF